jgi:hypothetical protein
MISSVISRHTDLSPSTSRLNAITPIPPSSPITGTTGKKHHNSFLSKFQIHLPIAISALATGVEPSGLPDNFQLTPFDVVCGRGKGSYNRPGNKLFRKIVHNHVDEYLAAKSKLDKSMVLSCIVDQVREQNNGCTRFVKQRRDNKTWYEIGDDLAREKVGHAIREAICARNAAAAEPQKDDTNEQADVVSHQVVFHNKQETLLTQQQLIFQEMINLKQTNALINAQLHEAAKNWQEQLQPPPFSALT